MRPNFPKRAPEYRANCRKVPPSRAKQSIPEVGRCASGCCPDVRYLPFFHVSRQSAISVLGGRRYPMPDSERRFCPPRICRITIHGPCQGVDGKQNPRRLYGTDIYCPEPAVRVSAESLFQLCSTPRVIHQRIQRFRSGPSTPTPPRERIVILDGRQNRDGGHRRYVI